MVSDPIGDFLTRIRNGLLAKKSEVVTRASKMSNKLAQILERRGYIKDIRLEGEGEKKYLRIGLCYDAKGKALAEGFKRISRPGLRAYKGAAELPKVRGGMGIAIVSTSKGVMTGEEAERLKVGGEILCYVW